MPVIRNHKREELERRILRDLPGIPGSVAKSVFDDDEILAMQDYANVVSIMRLNMNDHGPVHMRIAAMNSLKMLDLLVASGVRLNLETESGLPADDSRVAVFLAAMLHDIGMAVERDGHEEHALAKPLIDRILLKHYPDSLRRRIAITSTVLEGIAGHMTNRRVSSLEAGLVLIGDGCDMEHGRSRIPEKISPGPQVGDIHRYSASAVEKVVIEQGESRPIRILITMSENAGFFQVEQVLFPKIKASPVKPHIELFAGKRGGSLLQYL
jgi:hypothetical protein